MLRGQLASTAHTAVLYFQPDPCLRPAIKGPTACQPAPLEKKQRAQACLQAEDAQRVHHVIALLTHVVNTFDDALHLGLDGTQCNTSTNSLGGQCRLILYHLERK